MQKVKTTKMLLAITIVLYWFAQYVYIPFHTPYILSLGATASFAGVIVGAYGFTQMVLRVPIGVIADRRGRHKKFLILGLICAGLASAIRLLFPVPEAFLVANLLSGITSAAWVSVTVFFTSLFSENEMKKSTGFLLAANNGGILLGFVASLFVGETIGVWFVFAASIAAAVCGLITAALVRAAEPAQTKATIMRFVDIIKDKTLLFYAGLSMLLQAITSSTAVAFTSSYAEQFTTVKSDLSLSMIIFMGVSVIASLFIGRVKRMKDDVLLYILFVSLGISCVLLPMSSSMAGIYFCQGLAGIGNGAIMALLMTCAMKNIKKECKATMMGIFQAVYGIGMAFGPVFLGNLIDHWGYKTGYFGMAVLTIAAIAAIFIKRKWPFFIKGIRIANDAALHQTKKVMK